MQLGVKSEAVRHTTTPRGPSIHQLYALPVPIRTYPLPTFYPSNPLSLFHVLYTWLAQVVFPPVSEPSTVYQGVWSPETRSVHIREAESIRALWEQGFFGKGAFSRSEPNWFKREQARRGKRADHVAEEFTNKRREERKLMKWDRARKEQEAIERTKQQEAWVAPVGPLELLSLPNSLPNASALVNGALTPANTSGISSAGEAGFVPFPLLNGDTSRPQTPVNDLSATFSNPLSEDPQECVKRRKSVRFCPSVQSATFLLSDPPSPAPGLLPNGEVHDYAAANGNPLLSGPSDAALAALVSGQTSSKDSSEIATTDIVDKEHLQLMPEEAFYLVFALGALSVRDPGSQTLLTVQDLLKLFRQNSYFPPRMTGLQPDDPFLIHYVVYHHFRSLGWVVRPGIKFGVDWLLYNRGPVFSHAEFALIVMPAYTDPGWQGRQPPQRAWHWLHSINRVQATALKTLVLIYVDIPPPFGEELDVSTIVKRYKIREFIVKRWLSNRNRD
ncbi:hypothetical protein DL762_000256 [Monosporascus cannonballus]|uniref:tRNA-intron lyase n=1 Tax=Monosporascus cannonballus TaxID=155416 RepID=A0ABY0HNN4_9PEZI|nr:hypothetical protein DL762_000256 [Monosporascus cannonballus]